MAIETGETAETGQEANAVNGTGLQENELRLTDLLPGQIALVQVNGDGVAVYNANGIYYATQDRCAHIGWPLTDGGELTGTHVTCPMHGWCYDVSTGEVVRGMRTLKLKTYVIAIDGDILRVLPT